MISIKSEREIELMRYAGKVTIDTINLIGKNIKVGITTKQLDKMERKNDKKEGVIPLESFSNGQGLEAVRNADQTIST